MSVSEVFHPLIQDHLARLRDVSTGPAEFRVLTQRLAVLLAYEATKDLMVESIEVQTPLTKAPGHRLQQRVGLVPILRAGLGMVDPLLNLLPTAEVWHLGLFRDEATARPVAYYNKISEHEAVDVAFILDPMLATGGSARLALSALRDWGVSTIKLLSIIASQEGILQVQSEFPETQVFVCAVDPELNEHKFIVPGLGDAGDRAFNTPQ
ncbi:MAG: uracil phosphoribosyltransferase [Pirellulaceae bacterium]|nr:uracil phosphoribosyltransferase [Pirellulaceae bacterium]